MITKHYFSIYILAFTFLFLKVNEVDQSPTTPPSFSPETKFFSFEIFDAQINLYISRT
jgi:hypothetical protein